MKLSFRHYHLIKLSKVIKAYQRSNGISFSKFIDITFPKITIVHIKPPTINIKRKIDHDIMECNQYETHTNYNHDGIDCTQIA